MTYFSCFFFQKDYNNSPYIVTVFPRVILCHAPANKYTKYKIVKHPLLKTTKIKKKRRTYGTQTNRSPLSIRRFILDRIFDDSAIILMAALKNANKTAPAALYAANPI